MKTLTLRKTLAAARLFMKTLSLPAAAFSFYENAFIFRFAKNVYIEKYLRKTINTYIHKTILDIFFYVVNNRVKAKIIA